MTQNIYDRDDFFAACRSTCTPYCCPASPSSNLSTGGPASLAGGWTGRVGAPAGPLLDRRARTTDWLASGVVKRHRTLGSLLNLLIGFGLFVSNGWRSGAPATSKWPLA
ncbi:TPA: hypothetical protein ACXNHW_005493 [Pseudomonas aeruginosa]